MAHPDREAQRDDVNDVLASLGLAADDSPPRIEAWNKVDLLAADERERLSEEAKRRDDVVPISAVTGEGLDILRERLSESLRQGEEVHQIRLPVGDGGRIAWLHSRGEVLGQTVNHDEVELAVRLSPDNWARFQTLESA
jgi:GTP-binding protein HflX